MSDQYESSYYEIALTGRQVLVAFVILLVCVFAAFFSGVWVGRGDTAPAGRVVADFQPLDPSEEAGGDADGQAPIEELSFFEDRQANDSSADERAERQAQPARPVAEEPAPAPPEPRNSEPERAAPERTPDPVPEPARERTATETETSRPVATAESVETSAPTEAEAPAAASDLSSGDVVVQVIVTGDEARARDVLEQLRANRFRAFLSPVQSDGRTLYRVRLGPFERLADAETVAGRVKSQLGFETWITR